MSGYVPVSYFDLGRAKGQLSHLQRALGVVGSIGRGGRDWRGVHEARARQEQQQLVATRQGQFLRAIGQRNRDQDRKDKLDAEDRSRRDSWAKFDINRADDAEAARTAAEARRVDDERQDAAAAIAAANAREKARGVFAEDAVPRALTDLGTGDVETDEEADDYRGLREAADERDPALANALRRREAELAQDERKRREEVAKSQAAAAHRDTTEGNAAAARAQAAARAERDAADARAKAVVPVHPSARRYDPGAIGTDEEAEAYAGEVAAAPPPLVEAMRRRENEMALAERRAAAVDTRAGTRAESRDAEDLERDFAAVVFKVRSGPMGEFLSDEEVKAQAEALWNVTYPGRQMPGVPDAAQPAAASTGAGSPDLRGSKAGTLYSDLAAPIPVQPEVGPPNDSWAGQAPLVNQIVRRLEAQAKAQAAPPPVQLIDNAERYARMERVAALKEEIARAQAKRGANVPEPVSRPAPAGEAYAEDPTTGRRVTLGNLRQREQLASGAPGPGGALGGPGGPGALGGQGGGTAPEAAPIPITPPPPPTLDAALAAEGVDIEAANRQILEQGRAQQVPAFARDEATGEQVTAEGEGAKRFDNVGSGQARARAFLLSKTPEERLAKLKEMAADPEAAKQMGIDLTALLAEFGE